MTSNITTRDFHDNPVRVLADGNNEPWFVAKDICDILGLSNVTMTLSALDEDEVSQIDPKNYLGSGTRSNQPINIVSESGFYKLVMRSRKPVAKEFQRWVTHDVLPSIRRTGGYIPVKADDDEKSILARAVLIAQSALADKDRVIASQRTQIARAEPLAMTARALCDTRGSMTLTDAARHFMQLDPRMNRSRVIATLRGHGYLEQGSLAPTRKAIDPGYLKPIVGKRHDGRLGRQYAHFTPKGLGWFINRFVYGDAQGTLADEGMEEKA